MSFKYYKTTDLSVINSYLEYQNLLDTFNANALEYAVLVSEQVAPCISLVSKGVDTSFYGLKFNDDFDNPCWTKPDKYGVQRLRLKVAKKYQSELRIQTDILSIAWEKSFKNCLKEITPQNVIKAITDDKDDWIYTSPTTFVTKHTSTKYMLTKEGVFIVRVRKETSVKPVFIEITLTEFDNLRGQ